MRAFLSGKPPGPTSGNPKEGVRVPLLVDPAVSGVVKSFASGDEAFNQAEHRYGLLSMTLGVMLLIPDGTMTKMVHCTPLTGAAWRLGLTSLALALIQSARYGPLGLLKKIVQLGPWGLLVSAIKGLSNLCFSVAVRETTVANVVLCTATSPIFAAILGRVALGTTIRLRTWIAMPIVFLGVAVSISSGLKRALDLGEIMALLVAVMGALRRTIMREHAHIDMQPASTLGHGLFAVCLLLSGSVEPIGPGDFWPLFSLGFLLLPLSITLLTVGTQRLPATESCLLTSLETVFSPIMAAYCLGDEVPLHTWIGLGVVVVTLTLHSMPSSATTTAPASTASASVSDSASASV